MFFVNASCLHPFPPYDGSIYFFTMLIIWQFKFICQYYCNNLESPYYDIVKLKKKKKQDTNFM